MKPSLVLYIGFILILGNCKKDDSTASVTNPQIFVPTAFTPNGDKKNDSFVVKGNNLLYFSIIIFDKDNYVVFSSSNINQSWDGNYHGQPEPAGTYTWIIQYTSSDGVQHKQSGYVELVR